MDSVHRPIRLLLAIPHLGGGGAERVFALLALHLNPALFEIHLVLLAPDGPGSPVLPAHIHVHRLHCRVRYAAIPLLHLIRSLQPRLILSGMAHLSFLILLLKPLLPRSTRILLRQNTTASAAARAWLTRLAYRHLYPRAHRILCQSQEMANDLTQNFSIPSDKLAILHNPVPPPSLTPSAPPLDSSAPNLLFVGRFSHEKGADLLLHAFATLLEQTPCITLTLLGAGPEENSLRTLAQSLRIAHAIHFAGHVNPAAFYTQATLFVLPSRYEGLPNALLEAAAAGLPIVATPACDGLANLLRNSPGCWLTPHITASALAITIQEALSALVRAPRRFHHAFLQPFHLEPAIAAYSDLLLAESHPRLAFLIPTIDQIGGAERQVLDLVREFARRRWPVTLIALSGEGAAWPSILQTAGVRYLSLGMRKAWIDPRGWLRYLRWYRNTLPEILHAHLPHATFFARLSRILAPVPVLIDTIHTTAPGPFTRRLTYRLTHPLTNQVTCVSRAVQDAVRNTRIAPHPTLLPNGIHIPPPSHTATCTGAPHLEEIWETCDKTSFADSFHWLAVGRLAHVKDYPTLLHAFARLPLLATLTIAGSGPDEPQLRTLAEILGIVSRVHFVGFQSEIQPLLSQADAFVQSSLWEGLPIAILEASAASLPVVATSAAGTSEVVLPGRTGILTPVADITALAAAMRQLMDMHPRERRQMGLRGRTFVETNFSLSSVADQWQQLYHHLLREAALPSQRHPF